MEKGEREQGKEEGRKENESMKECMEGGGKVGRKEGKVLKIFILAAFSRSFVLSFSLSLVFFIPCQILSFYSFILSLKKRKIK